MAAQKSRNVPKVPDWTVNLQMARECLPLTSALSRLLDTGKGESAGSEGQVVKLEDIQPSKILEAVDKFSEGIIF